jgi:hypothetical protein
MEVGMELILELKRNYPQEYIPIIYSFKRLKVGSIINMEQ